MKPRLKNKSDLTKSQHQIEIYRPVSDCGDYLISNLGNVKRKHDGKQMRLWESKPGYLAFEVTCRGKRRKYQVAREVLKAFYVGWEDFKVTVQQKYRKKTYKNWYSLHIDGDTLNNNLSNLTFQTGADKSTELQKQHGNPEVYKLSSKWQNRKNK